MIIQINNPTPELDHDIFTYIPSTKRIKIGDVHYIITLHATRDIFSKRVDIIVQTDYIKMDLHYYDGKDCESTEKCTEDYYDLWEKEANQ